MFKTTENVNLKMSCLLLFMLITSSTAIGVTKAKMQLMSAKMLRNITLNPKSDLKNVDEVIISEQTKKFIPIQGATKFHEAREIWPDGIVYYEIDMRSSNRFDSKFRS